MARYVLVKRKGSKNWVGAIPVKKGVSLKRLRASLGKGLKAGWTYRVSDGAGVKKAVRAVAFRRRKKK